MDHQKIIDSLRHCSVKGNSCRECPSYHQDSGCLDELHAEAAALLEAQQKRIAELEAKGKWIPVTERLPGEGGILATDGEQLYFTNGSWFYKSLSGKIRIPANYGAGADVTHWMPLPEGPGEVHNEAM